MESVPKEKLLIVEDTPSLREVLATVLEEEGYKVDAVGSAEAAMIQLAANQYSAVLADFKLPGENGIQLLKRVRDLPSKVPFIIMTAYGSVNIAVEAMKFGANDFVTKPFDPPVLCKVIEDIIKHKRIIDRSSGIRTRRERSLLTGSASLQKILEQAKKVARVDTSVLILGESGTGKELLARFIHENSPRHAEPFVAVNCAAIPSELLESEFFGHEAGAFTGATQSRIGVLEHASEGTIFLDEVGDMPPSLQVKLLRALQEREVRRVGGTKNIKINPRVLAATNRSIDDCLGDGSVREDFYYRLAVVTLSLPPLRERPKDIEILTEFYLEYFSTTMRKPKQVVTPEAKQILERYSWPGNARELENVIERATVMAEADIRPEHLGILLEPSLDALNETARVTLPMIAAQAAQKAEIDLIRRTLERTSGNKRRAAELLGVSYKTLLTKVKDYHLGVSTGEDESLHESISEESR